MFLEKKKSLSKKKIKNFLGEIGLRNRFDVLLRLLAAEKDLSGIDRDIILKTIGWRNKIAHEGKLPEDTADSELRQGIANVVALSRILRLKIHQIDSEPMFQTIVDNVKEKYGLSSLWIYSVTLRKIYMNLTLNLGERDQFSEKLVAEITKFSIQLIASEIQRFEPKQDFYAKIYSFPNPEPVASYAKGELKYFKRPNRPSNQIL